MNIRGTTKNFNKSFWLCSAFIALSSCTSCVVVSYQPVANDFGHGLPQRKTLDSLAFLVKRSYEKEINAAMGVEFDQETILSSSDWEYLTIRKTLENYSPANTIIDPTTRERLQTFVEVTLYYDYEASYSHQGWCEASFMTLAIIPCYGELSVHDARYSLYIDGSLQKEYVYRYSGKGAYWIGLLPFSWINLFTRGREEALAGTTHQFLSRAKKDGLF